MAQFPISQFKQKPMFDLLNSPYPVYRLNKRRMTIILGIGIFVAFFLLVFQPFGTEQATFDHKNWFLTGYGIVISASILLMEILLNFLYFKNLKEENWKVGKQIIWTAFFVSGSLLACYFYKQWFFDNNISWKSFWGFYSLAITIAIFPIIIVTFLDYIYQLQKNKTIATKLNNNTAKATNSNINTEKKSIIQLTAENGKDKLEIPTPQLLYIQSADNYVEIILKIEGLYLVQDNIIIEIKDKKTGWINVDLSDYNIITNKDVIITLQWIDASENGTHLAIPIKWPVLGSHHYYKYGSQAKWNHFKMMSAVMNVKLAYN